MEWHLKQVILLRLKHIGSVRLRFQVQNRYLLVLNGKLANVVVFHILVQLDLAEWPLTYLTQWSLTNLTSRINLLNILRLNDE